MAGPETLLSTALRKRVIDHILRYDLFRHRTLDREFSRAIKRGPQRTGSDRTARAISDILFYLCKAHYEEHVPSISDIYLSAGLSKGTVIAHIQTLQRLGIVEKTASPRDRRRVRVSFTDPYQAILSAFVDQCYEEFGDHIAPDNSDGYRFRAEQAEQASRSKTAFLANLSHDIRVQLNIIIGFAEIIETETFGPIEPVEYRDYFGNIREAALHLHGVVNDVIDLSQIELSGSLPVDNSVVDLAEVLEGCIKLVHNSAKGRGLRLRSRIDTTLPDLFIDPRRLRQIVFNLLSNAIKFTPEGGAVTLGAAPARNGGIEIRVSDTGRGIAPTELAAMMEPFRREAAASEVSANGGGLGLSISKALTELMDGELSLGSKPGKGTTARVWFPASRLR